MQRHCMHSTCLALPYSLVTCTFILSWFQPSNFVAVVFAQLQSTLSQAKVVDPLHTLQNFTCTWRVGALNWCAIYYLFTLGDLTQRKCIVKLEIVTRKSNSSEVCPNLLILNATVIWDSYFVRKFHHVPTYVSALLIVTLTDTIVAPRSGYWCICHCAGLRLRVR